MPTPNPKTFGVMTVHRGEPVAIAHNLTMAEASERVDKERMQGRKATYSFDHFTEHEGGIPCSRCSVVVDNLTHLKRWA
jgi:hypothetical protein